MPSSGHLNRLQQLRVRPGRAVLVDRGRTAGQNQPFRLAGENFFDWSVKGQDFAIDAGLTNAAGYQLSVLRSEVKYYDGFVLSFRYQKRRPLGALNASNTLQIIDELWIIRLDMNNSRTERRCHSALS